MHATDSSPTISTLAAKKLFEVTRKRLERFASLVPKALISEHPDTIHDVRVWSRRLQQVLKILAPKPRADGGRKLVRRVRRIRRALGNCRNLDVCIELIQHKLDSANGEVVRNAWERIHTDLSEKRAVELVRCREDLSRYDIIAFITRTQALLQTAKLAKDLDQTLRTSVEDAFAEWQEAFTAARESQEVGPVHAFRLAGKRLRYRAELLADLGEPNAKALVKSLKLLQDDLGHWHDCFVLLRFVAEFLGRPDFLVEQPEISRILLTEMEKERHRNGSAVTNILKSAEKIREWKLADPME
jgi:CHAD domain-containing protein